MHLDIYLEILRYLDFSIEDDDTDFISTNRRTVYSLALTCTRFSNIALDALWRSMTTLEPIVNVLNASSLKPLVTCTLGYWKAHFTRDTISRAQVYLSRIKTLHFESFPGPSERALWQMLLGLGNIPVLCPNLRRLSLDLDELEEDEPNIVYSLTPLLSPSLEALLLTPHEPFGEEVALTLLDICHRRDIRLRHISYDNYVSRRMDQHFTQFPSLRVLCICASNLDDDWEDSDMSEMETLCNLTQLTELRIDLRCFLPNPRVGDTLSALAAVTTLQLDGTWESFNAARVIDHTFHNVKSLGLCFVRGGEDLSRSSLLSHVSPSFPNLHSLTLDIQRCVQRDTHPGLSDIQKLRNLPLKSLQLLGRWYVLLPEDIIELIKTWPTLESLRIDPSSHEVFSAGPILEKISSHGGHLKSLALPLDLCSWSSSSSWGQLLPSFCLQNLELCDGSSLPNDMTNKLDLARALVALFPRLEIQTEQENDAENDLAKMVDWMRSRF